MTGVSETRAVRREGSNLMSVVTTVLLAVATVVASLEYGLPARAASSTSHIRRASPSTQHGPAIISFDETTSVRIYLVALGDQGRFGKRVGCGDSLVPVTRSIAPTRAPLTATIRLLLGDHHKFYGQSGLFNALYQARLKVDRATVRQGRAIIHLSGNLQLSGECDDPRVEGQLKQTALQFQSVHNVAIFINNVPLRRVLGGKGS
jgi:hypothetical protein